MLLTSHQRKQGASSVLYRAIGSLAFTSVARSVLMIGEDPTISGRRLLLPTKMTLQSRGEGSAFRIAEGRVEWEPEGVPLQADDLQQMTKSRTAGADVRREAAAWLEGELAGGPLSSAEVMRRAAERSIPHNALWDAKKLASVKAVRKGRVWYWELSTPWDLAPATWWENPESARGLEGFLRGRGG